MKQGTEVWEKMNVLKGSDDLLLYMHWWFNAPCYAYIQMYMSKIRHIVQQPPNSYMKSDGRLPFTTSGCLCTLGIKPRPMALRMAFAIFLWFFGRRPVSLECFIRPISVMYSDIILKFYPDQHPDLSQTFVVPTLYSFTGLIPSTSKASLWGFLRPSFHFFCSVPVKSWGE